jgi:hypothetical protein
MDDPHLSEGSQTVEDTANLDGLMVSGKSKRAATHTRPAIGLVGKLMVGAALAIAAMGTTVALAHAASARPADSVFVTPGASTGPTASHEVTGGPSASVVAPPEADHPGAVPSQVPDGDHSAPSQTDEPYAGQRDYLNDGLSDDPGQPRQPAVPQDPSSNG